jgi:hypothetical protein
MATVNLSFTIPDDRVADYTAALRYRYGKNPDGTDRTNAQLLALLKSDFAAQLDSYYRKWKKNDDKRDLGIS